MNTKPVGRTAAPASAVKSEPSLYDELYRSLKDGEESVTFDRDCHEELFETYKKMCGEHPELFWLDGGGSMKMTTRGSAVSLTMTPTRTVSAEETAAAKAELDQAVRAILRTVPKTASDYEKVLAVHDRIVTDTEYDHAALERFQADGGKGSSLGVSSNAYGCLIRHTAVCSGYSAAFLLLMNELGVPCMTVTGADRRNGVPHAWNCVQVEGDWYFIDVTWDDPTYAEGAGEHGINRDCFLITAAELLRDHEIGGGQQVPPCTATKCNYFVKNGLKLPAYSLEAAADAVRSQIGNEEIVLKLPNEAEAKKAADDLFGQKRIFEIVKLTGSISVRYSIGKSGVLTIRLS